MRSIAFLVVASVSCTNGAGPGELSGSVVVERSGGIAWTQVYTAFETNPPRYRRAECGALATMPCGDTAASTIGRAEVETLLERFVDAGFFGFDEEYGDECCDQYFYSVRLDIDGASRTVTGADGTLPQTLLVVLQAVDSVARTR